MIIAERDFLDEDWDAAIAVLPENAVIAYHEGGWADDGRELFLVSFD